MTLVSLHTAARELGLRPSTLLRDWAALAASEDMPAPATLNPSPKWSLEAIQAWRADRTSGRRFVDLTQGQVAIIDAADWPAIRPFKWFAVRRSDGRGFYAARTLAGRRVWMHRQIMVAPDDRLVDHRDGNGLHNRRQNLRLATTKQNVWNRPTPGPWRGVRACATGWQAHIHVGGRRRSLGVYPDAETAARAYDKAAIATRKEFAVLNFPVRL